MSSALIGVASAFPLPNTCTVPDPGDPVRAEDVQIVAQTLLNQDRAIEVAFTPAVVDTWISVRSPVINEVSKSASSYSITLDPGDIGSQLIDFPNGVSIDGLRVYVDPGAHGGIAPGTKLTVSIWRRQRSTNTETSVLAFTTDTTSPIATYDTFHVVEAMFADHTIDNSTYIYYVRVDGELAPDEQSVVWHGSSVRVSMSSVSWV